LEGKGEGGRKRRGGGTGLEAGGAAREGMTDNKISRKKRKKKRDPSKKGPREEGQDGESMGAEKRHAGKDRGRPATLQVPNEGSSTPRRGRRIDPSPCWLKKKGNDQRNILAKGN